MSKFFVVFAPGHYGDSCKILSSHRTYAAALKRIADTTTLVIRQGKLKKGDTFYRTSEAVYPYASGEAAPEPETDPDCDALGCEGEYECKRCGAEMRSVDE